MECALCMSKIGAFDAKFTNFGYTTCLICNGRCQKIKNFSMYTSDVQFRNEINNFKAVAKNKVVAGIIADKVEKEFYLNSPQIAEYMENAKENQQEKREKEIQSLKDRGMDGYYEYTALSLVDINGGYVDVQKIISELNTLGRQGWHFVSAYSNEIGHNSTSGGAFGVSTGTNATIDQNVLILERFVKF